MYALALLLQEEGPNTSLSWLLWVVLGLFVLIVLIGWWVSRNRATEPDIEREPEIVEETHQDKKPLDDLTELEGIGPKVAQVLNRAGIASYSDLALADPAALRQVLAAAGMNYMDPTGWIEQAKLAASGDVEGLKKLQNELKGGRRVS